MGRLVIAAFAGALLTACGGGSVQVTGSSDTDDSTSAARAAVVAVDLDADGLVDLATVARDGTGATRCWRNVGDGEFVRPLGAWVGSRALVALADDLDALDDAALLDGYGAHRAGGARGDGFPYAVLHAGAAVAPSAVPVVDAIEPAAGAVRDVVLLRGRGLASRGSPTSVTFQGSAATVLFASADVVVAVVPDGLHAGRVDVRTTSGPLVGDPVAFDVRARPVPAVESLLPSIATPGGALLLRGEGLGGPGQRVEVAFASARAVGALGLSTEALVIVPDGARSGPAVVSVDGVVSAPFDVTVGSAVVPVVSGLVPRSASAGSLLRIEGRDLLGAVQSPRVHVGGVEAAVFSLEAEAVTVVVPASAVDGDVVVMVGDLASAGVSFSVASRGAPRIDALWPAETSVGHVLSVRGTDLVDLSGWRPDRQPPSPAFGDLRVTVGGADAWLVLPDEGGLRAVVPEGAASGDVVVTVNGRSSDPVPVTIR
jgi:hypothetical protein